MNSLLHPFWTGNEMINELATPLRRPDGSVEDIALLYPADEILSVRSATLERTFAPGADYRLENGKLVIPAGSAIPAMAYGDYYLNHADAPEKCFPHSICGWIRFGEGDYFHQRQIAVSYRHHGTWPFPVPEDRSALLPRTTKTLAQGEPMRLLIFGDSISTGCNASGWAKELNLVSWGGNQPKFDIREWSPDHTKMSKGITLSNVEAETLFKCMSRKGIGTADRPAAATV